MTAKEQRLSDMLVRLSNNVDDIVEALIDSIAESTPRGLYTTKEIKVWQSEADDINRCFDDLLIYVSRELKEKDIKKLS